VKLGLLLAACLAAGCARSEATQRGKKDMKDDVVREAKDIVSKISAAKELTRAELERLLGVKLARAKGVGPDLLYFEGPLPSGPFSAVEVREPNPQQDRTWLVNLTVREGVSLPLSSFRDTIPKDAPFDMEPRVPPEGVVTYSVKTPTQTLYFGFRSKSEAMESVSIHRPPD
jgi:hypothetical protein